MVLWETDSDRNFASWISVRVVPFLLGVWARLVAGAAGDSPGGEGEARDVELVLDCGSRLVGPCSFGIKTD